MQIYLILEYWIKLSSLSLFIKPLQIAQYLRDLKQVLQIFKISTCTILIRWVILSTILFLLQGVQKERTKRKKSNRLVWQLTGRFETKAIPPEVSTQLWPKFVRIFVFHPNIPLFLGFLNMTFHPKTPKRGVLFSGSPGTYSKNDNFCYF